MKTIKEILLDSLTKICREAFPETTNILPSIVPAKKKEFGDYTTNIAMVLAKNFKLTPDKIAEKIIPLLPKEFFFSAKVEGPGFINFKISPVLFKNTILSIVDGSYFISEPTKRKIIIEFVSANPTGPLNVVSARAAAIGDSICRILRATGEDVFAEYYVNDTGNQITLLAESILIRIKQLQNDFSCELKEEHYQGEYLIPIAKEIIEKNIIPENISEEEKLKIIADFAVSKILESHKKDLESYRVIFNNWQKESELHSSGKVNKILQLLKNTGKVYEKEKRLWFKSTDYGDEKDRVIVREDGRFTYLLPDIAYHYSKVERGFDLMIDLWGPDHYGYIKRLSGALQALGISEEKFSVKIVQQVNLIENGEKIKMSKRTGKIIQMAELIEEVGTDATRFFLIARNISSHLDFDLSLARKQSDENPVFYIQYASARIHSILREINKREIKITPEWEEGIILSPSEEELVKNLCLYAEYLKESALKMEPNILGNYLYTLAGSFHRFYNEMPVITEKDKTKQNFRFLLLLATKEVLTKGLYLLGITAPERMEKE